MKVCTGLSYASEQNARRPPAGLEGYGAVLIRRKRFLRSTFQWFETASTKLGIIDESTGIAVVLEQSSCSSHWNVRERDLYEL